LSRKHTFRADEVGDRWEDVSAELDRAFQMSRAAALAGESFVYVVHSDDLFGRRGPGGAMIAAGLVSAARTAASEGSRLGWTANVIAYDEGTDEAEIDRWTKLMRDSHGVTGQLIQIGPGHVGKALS